MEWPSGKHSFTVRPASRRRSLFQALATASVWLKREGPRTPNDVLCSAAVLVVVNSVRAIDPAVGIDAVVDVVLERGRIARLGPNVGEEAKRAEGVRVIDGAGRWLLPAFVDLHAHFREPGQEYKEEIRTGLAAAAAGGYAHVCAMPNTKPVNDTRAVTEMMVHRAKETGGPTLHPIGAITMGLQGQQLTEMADLREAGIVAVSDDGVCLQSSAVMRRALEYAANFGLPVIQHAEDAELVAHGDMNEGEVASRLGLRGRPRVAEDIIVARDLLLAEWVKAHYHVAHLSSRGAVRLVRDAKDRGVNVTSEVTPHHLLLTDAACLGYDTFCKVNPPLREAEDVAAVVAALADGTIDAIATDHAPHSPLEKDCEFQIASAGMIGLELCFGLLLGLVERGDVALTRLIDALSTRPARIIGIEPPSLVEGRLADLVLVDPTAKFLVSPGRLRSKSHNTPFLNRELVGKVLLTIASGKIVFDAINETQ
jgi:dihydroorotase